MAVNYTNAQVRSILNGLGFRSRIFSSDRANPSFPYTEDNSALADVVTQHAIRKFQTEYKLTVDGIAGSETKAKIATLLVREKLYEKSGGAASVNHAESLVVYGT
jgi:peptidoglycan hydrolase-like protein with peptidoglycan-binding domain